MAIWLVVMEHCHRLLRGNARRGADSSEGYVAKVDCEHVCDIKACGSTPWTGVAPLGCREGNEFADLPFSAGPGFALIISVQSAFMIWEKCPTEPRQ